MKALSAKGKLGLVVDAVAGPGQPYGKQRTQAQAHTHALHVHVWHSMIPRQLNTALTPGGSAYLLCLPSARASSASVALPSSSVRPLPSARASASAKEQTERAWEGEKA